MIELILFLCLLVGFFVVAGLIGETNQLDQREEQQRIRKSIQRDAAFHIGRNWIWEGKRK